MEAWVYLRSRRVTPTPSPSSPSRMVIHLCWMGTSKRERQEVVVVNKKQHRQCTVHIMQNWVAFLQQLLLGESSKYYILWVCVCSLRYPAWNARAPIVMWAPQFYKIFPHLINSTILRKKKKLLNTKFVFWFSLQLVSATFLNLRRTEPDMVQNI